MTRIFTPITFVFGNVGLIRNLLPKDAHPALGMRTIPSVLHGIYGTYMTRLPISPLFSHLHCIGQKTHQSTPHNEGCLYHHNQYPECLTIA